jgi:hypothetical protein
MNFGCCLSYFGGDRYQVGEFGRRCRYSVYFTEHALLEQSFKFDFKNVKNNLTNVKNQDRFDEKIFTKSLAYQVETRGL